jgi:hypothetical protein
MSTIYSYKYFVFFSEKATSLDNFSDISDVTCWGTLDQEYGQTEKKTRRTGLDKRQSFYYQFYFEISGWTNALNIFFVQEAALWLALPSLPLTIYRRSGKVSFG